jgi:hypothetical protein
VKILEKKKGKNRTFRDQEERVVDEEERRDRGHV